MDCNRKYQPSNGTEGMCFMENFCDQCIHDNVESKKYCEIVTLTMSLDIKDKDYPKEWVYDENDKPTCTNWQKWDWGNNDDGRNDPPKPPYEPQDPNQLMLFSLADDILKNHKVKVYD